MNPTGILRKCNSWQDFRASLKDFSKKDKGDCFESLTKYFLSLDPKYATLLKNVWPLRKVPANIRTYLNLPDPDEGIDLLAETKGGQYWAIQCKYLEDERGSLGRHSLSTFFDLSFNLCKHINFCLVCTTADRFSYKLARYGERLGLCSGETWRSHDDGFFSRLHRLVDGASVALAPLKPRPHQRVAVSNAYRHFVKARYLRGKLIMPCGTGKTLAAYWIAEKLKAQTILLAAPSLALIGQTLEVWSREFVADEKNVRWIAVCSDESVGEFERDDISILTQDLGIHVHTDPDEIAEWLQQRKDEKTVVFTTYQSGRAVGEAARKAGTSFDLGIMDEAHKTVGRKHNLFGHLLFDENIDIKKRIFMTATERRYLGQSGQIASMDDPKLYGETFELLTFKKALESRPSILSDYEIVTIGVTRREVAALIKGNLFVRPDTGTWDNDVEAETLAALIALRKAMLKYPIRHAVSFHSRIARAKIFAENVSAFTMAFPAYGNLETFHVYGGMPTDIRKQEMDTFAAANGALITNARCLPEGVDVPNIDAVLFADPKRSTVDIVQAVGRALRPSPGKRFGYVIVPVLLDREPRDGQPPDQNGFENVLTVLRALAANDERIIEYFRGISQGRRPTRGKNVFSLDIPEGVQIDTDNFIHSIELQFWSRLAKLSWRPFEEARTYSRSLKLKNVREWEEYCQGKAPNKITRPADIPTAPQDVYKDNGWST